MTVFKIPGYLLLCVFVLYTFIDFLDTEKFTFLPVPEKFHDKVTFAKGVIK